MYIYKLHIFLHHEGVRRDFLQKPNHNADPPEDEEGTGHEMVNKTEKSLQFEVNDSFSE